MEFVDEQVRLGRYSSVSDYVCELIRDDARRKVGERLEALLLEGLHSGDPIFVTGEFWEERRSELLRRADLHQKNDVKKVIPNVTVCPQAHNDIDDQGSRVLSGLPSNSC